MGPAKQDRQTAEFFCLAVPILNKEVVSKPNRQVDPHVAKANYKRRHSL